MRTELGRALLTIACGLCLTVGPAAAQTDAGRPDDVAGELSAGHGERSDGPPLLAPSRDELRVRAKRLHSQIMCACPEENWSRTLANCPDACADPQKREVLGMLEQGQSDQDILTFMEGRYGPRVRSNPGFGGTGKWAFILPVVALLGGAWFAGTVVRRWQREGERARVDRRRRREDFSPEEIARIERDLESIE